MKPMSCGFKINAAKIKDLKKNEVFRKVSRKCLAQVTKIGKHWYANVLKNDETSNDFVISLRLTDKSLSLRDKQFIFTTYKDEHGHQMCFIRTALEAMISPKGIIPYQAVKEGIVVAGYIVRDQGKLYFEYTEFVSFTNNPEVYLVKVRINKDKPLMNDRRSKSEDWS